VKRSYRSPHLSATPGWGPAPGWAQPHLPGWSPLVDHGSLPGRVAGSVGRWWWPTLALAGFGAVAGFILGHDQPGPNLSPRGLLTIALAAVVVILLSIHRTVGPARLARATAEYTVVAVLTALLVLAGGPDQPTSDTSSSSARTEAKQTGTSKSGVNTGEYRTGVLRAAVAVTQAVTKVIRAVTGAVGWLVDLWRQADTKTDRTSRSPTTTTPKAAVMPPSSATALSTRRLL
jgi:hypothetical protein